MKIGAKLELTGSIAPKGHEYRQHIVGDKYPNVCPSFVESYITNVNSATVTTTGSSFCQFTQQRVVVFVATSYALGIQDATIRNRKRAKTRRRKNGWKGRLKTRGRRNGVLTSWNQLVKCNPRELVVYDYGIEIHDTA